MTKSFEDALRELVSTSSLNRYPQLTEGQLNHITAKLLDDPVFNLNKVLGKLFDDDKQMLGFLLDKLGREEPQMFRPVPSVEELLKLAAEDHQRIYGVMMPPDVRLSVFRELSELSPDARLSRTPADYEPTPEPSPAPEQHRASPPASKQYKQMSVQELDEEIRTTWGKDPRQMLESDRRRYHDALRSKDSAPKQTIQPLIDAGARDEAKLDAVARITRHREQQRAAQARK